MAMKNHKLRRSICVFCSSSDGIDAKYFEIARKLGSYLGAHGFTLVYGGGSIGLMGELARAVHQNGGRVIGVIPHWMRVKGISYEEADELLISEGLRDRKQLMEERAEGFVALPGGIGTLDELCETLALRLLHVHEKPLWILNAFGFYDPLLMLFEEFYRQGFAPERMRDYYHVVNSVEELMQSLHEVFTLN